MAGISLMAEPLSNRIQSLYSERIGPTNPLSSALNALSLTSAMTVAATVATLPLIAFYFQHLSLIGLPTTALVLPALPPLLATQASAGLVGLINPTLAQPFCWLAWLATAYVPDIVALVARPPGASAPGRPRGGGWAGGPERERSGSARGRGWRSGRRRRVARGGFGTAPGRRRRSPYRRS